MLEKILNGAKMYCVKKKFVVYILNILFYKLKALIKGMYWDISLSFRKPGSTSSPISPPPPMDLDYPMRERPSLNRMVFNSATSKQAPVLNPSVSKDLSLYTLNSSVIA